jgi:hypothetical protein
MRTRFQPDWLVNRASSLSQIRSFFGWRSVARLQSFRWYPLEPSARSAAILVKQLYARCLQSTANGRSIRESHCGFSVDRFSTMAHDSRDSRTRSAADHRNSARAALICAPKIVFEGSPRPFREVEPLIVQLGRATEELKTRLEWGEQPSWNVQPDQARGLRPLIPSSVFACATARPGRCRFRR